MNPNARLKLIGFSLLLMAFLACACSDEERLVEKENVSAEAERVYYAAVSHWFRESDSTRHLAILNPAMPIHRFDGPDKFASLSNAAAATFRDGTTGPEQFTSEMFAELPFQVRVIEKSTLVGEDGEILDDRFQAEGIQSGLLSLSVVWFNSDRSLAILHGEYTHCPLCGFGEALLLRLEETGGGWKVVDRLGFWIS